MEDADEFCPHCDNHFVLDAIEPKARLEVEGDDARIDSRYSSMAQHIIPLDTETLQDDQRRTGTARRSEDDIRRQGRCAPARIRGSIVYHHGSASYLHGTASIRVVEGIL